eukprot:366134-Chlamydomonas_euryale.AAC.19
MLDRGWSAKPAFVEPCARRITRVTRAPSCKLPRVPAAKASGAESGSCQGTRRQVLRAAAAASALRRAAIAVSASLRERQLARAPSPESGSCRAEPPC